MTGEETTVTTVNASSASQTVTDFLSNLTPTDALAIGLVSAFGFLVIWYLLSRGNMKLTFWHFGFMGVSGFLIGTALQAYGRVWEWISAGLHFDNIGASLFTIGLIAMIGVLLWNMIATNGRTLVR